MPTIRRALLAFFLTVALLPLALLASATYLSVRSNVEAAIRAKNEVLASTAGLFVRKSLDDAENLLRHAMDMALDMEPRAAETLLDSLLVDEGAFELVQVLDLAGRVLAQAPFEEEALGTDMSRQEYFGEADPGGRSVYGQTFLSAASGNPTIAVSFRSGDRICVGLFRLDWLNDLVDSLAWGRDGRITILDRIGTMVAFKDRSRVRSRYNAGYLIESLNADGPLEGTHRYTFLGVERLGSVVVDEPRGWTLVVSEPVSDAFEATRRVSLIALLGSLLSVAAAGAAALAAGRSLLKSFELLNREVAAVAAGTYQSIGYQPFYKETQEFLRAFNDMSTAVRSREESLARARDDLASALADKEVLLREVHHRVKNNLQVISSLLRLQEDLAGTTEVAEHLQKARLRVQTMALVHEKLYEADSAESIDLAAYLRDLAGVLLELHERPGIDVVVEGEGIKLDLGRAIPCALACFECVANALKHGFPEGRSGKVSVRLSASSGRAEVEIWDDGVGFPGDFEERSSGGLGWHLVMNLAAQLGGTAARFEGSGAVVKISFPLESGTP